MFTGTKYQQVWGGGVIMRQIRRKGGGECTVVPIRVYVSGLCVVLHSWGGGDGKGDGIKRVVGYGYVWGEGIHKEKK